MNLRHIALTLAIVGLWLFGGVRLLHGAQAGAQARPLAQAAPSLTYTLALPLTYGGVPNLMVFDAQIDQLRWFPNELRLVTTNNTFIRTLYTCPYTMDLAWAPNAQKVAFTCQGQIGIAKVDGTGYSIVAPATDHYFPDWLSNETMLFVARRPPSPNDWQLFTLQVATGIEAPLTVGVTRTWLPRVSPNLQMIAFNGPGEVVYVTNTNGTGTHALQKPGGATAIGEFAGWYPDSEQVLFVDSATAACTRLRIDGTAAVVLNYPTCSVSFSPTASQALYHSGRDIWIMDGAGQNQQVLWAAPDWGANFYLYPQWQPAAAMLP